MQKKKEKIYNKNARFYAWTQKKRKRTHAHAHNRADKKESMDAARSGFCSNYIAQEASAASAEFGFEKEEVVNVLCIPQAGLGAFTFL